MVFATLDERDEFERIVRPLLGKACRLSVDPTEITLEEAKAGAAAEAAQKREAALKAAAATATSYYPRTPTDSWSGESEGEKAQLFTTLTILPLAAATERRCGAKAAKCAELEAMATSSRGLFKTPNGCCVPFGSMEMALLEASSAVQREFKELLASLDKPDLTGDALEAACNQIINLVSNLDLPALMLDEICGTFKPSALLAIRSSANVEDLAGMSAAGLYESVVGVEAYDRAAVQKAVTAVWASLYTRRAVLSRRIAKVPQKEATMCVLCQQLHLPKVSFVLHTARPSDWNTGILLVEAAPGQGETLAAATSGTPWRFEVNKKTGAVNTLAFANFSSALVLSPGRPQDGLVLAEVDYSKQRLTVDVEYRSAFGRRLAAVGSAIESFFDGVPQDIEGGLVPIEGTQDSELYIFQTRPQH